MRRPTSSEETDKAATIRFRAWDDDKVLYCEGVCVNDTGVWERLSEELQSGWGTTLVTFYDRSTGKEIDSIG